MQCARSLPRSLLCAVVMLVGMAADAQGVAPSPAARAVAPGVYVLRGSGGDVEPENRGRIANVAFVVGTRGVVVVDTGVSLRHGEAIVAAIASVTSRPIRLAIVTHPDQEVVFGAAAFQARGIPVLMHRDGASLVAARCEQCLRRLEDALGAREMAGTRVVVPDRTIDASAALDVAGTRLLLIAPRESSAPGSLAVLDQRTGTLIAGALVPVGRIPDMRDSDGKGWRATLAILASTHCARLIPAYGRVADCAAIEAVDRYFAALDARVRQLFAAGVGLAEVPARCDLPAFAEWDGYATLHKANASRAFLAVERASFAR